ncbi:hypothetical protein [Catenulispora yoronensis]
MTLVLDTPVPSPRYCSSIEHERQADVVLTQAIARVVAEQSLSLSVMDVDRLRGAWYVPALAYVLYDPESPELPRIVAELISRALAGWPGGLADRIAAYGPLL